MGGEEESNGSAAITGTEEVASLEDVPDSGIELVALNRDGDNDGEAEELGMLKAA